MAKVQSFHVIKTFLHSCTLFCDVILCAPFWGTAAGRWRQERRGGKLSVWRLLKLEEQQEEQDYQQEAMSNRSASFHKRASLVLWNKFVQLWHRWASSITISHQELKKSVCVFTPCHSSSTDWISSLRSCWERRRGAASLHASSGRSQTPEREVQENSGSTRLKCKSSETRKYEKTK